MSTPYEAEENLIDEWTLNYLPAEGGRYTGKLAITDKNIYFFAQFSIEFSGNAVQNAEGGIRIAKENVESVEGKKSMFIFQRVEVRLNDGSIHVFDRGIMSVKSIVDAMTQ
jgi:hypothetical protein